MVATLVCDGAVKDFTVPFALSTTGDGSTRDTVSVGSGCEDPTVLIQPAANPTVYITATPNDDD